MNRPTTIAAVGARPTVSILVVVRNERHHINACLSQICAQDYPEDLLEIIIVDSMSDDGTVEAAESFPTRGIKLKALSIPERGRAQGLNRGIRVATGALIVRIDARTIIGVDYVSRCVETILETGADNVGGVRKPIAHSATQEAIGLALSHPFGVGSTHSRLGGKSGNVDSVYLGCFRRDIFDKVGLFDEDAAVINEDWDLNYRIRAAGGKVYLNAEISAYYLPRESLRDLWRLYFRYGGARVGNLLKHRNFGSWRYVVAPTFVLSVFLGLLLAAFDKTFLYVVLLLIALYSLVDLGVALRIAHEKKRYSLLPQLLLAFPFMHFSWGFGFWKRLVIPQARGTYWS